MGFLAAAFIAVWLLVTLFLVYMGQRQRNLEQELEMLAAQLADKQAESS